jgi:hypothetical protein
VQAPDVEGTAVEDTDVLDEGIETVELGWVQSPKSGWQPVPQKLESDPQKKDSEQPISKISSDQGRIKFWVERRWLAMPGEQGKGYTSERLTVSKHTA